MCANQNQFAVFAQVRHNQVLGRIRRQLGPQRRCQCIHLLSTLDNFIQSATITGFEQIFESNYGHDNVTELAIFEVVW